MFDTVIDSLTACTKLLNSAFWLCTAASCSEPTQMGKLVGTKVVNPHGYPLNYNEFIVYDVKQIKMKYRES